MSVYVYQCKGCGHVFEVRLSIREHQHRGAKKACPKCRSSKVEQRPSAFQAMTAHKS